MKIAVCLVPVLFLAGCAKPKPVPPASMVRALHADVIFTVEVYDVPSRDELLRDSLQVFTAAQALNFRDRLDDVNATLLSKPRIATRYGLPATISQGGRGESGFAFRADATVGEGDQLDAHFSWFDLAAPAHLQTLPSSSTETSWATTVERSGVVALRLPLATDGTPRVALVRVETPQR